jgi:hypothetical protein
VQAFWLSVGNGQQARDCDGKEGVAGSSRQRALENPLETAGFFVVVATRIGGDSLRGPHLGRVLEVSGFAEGVKRGPNTRGGTPNPSVASRSMPDDHAVQTWIRRNEAARAEDRRRDLERSMSERLEEAVRLSRIAAELETNLRREPDVRTG